jgi:hypothetical protein
MQVSRPKVGQMNSCAANDVSLILLMRSVRNIFPNTLRPAMTIELVAYPKLRSAPPDTPAMFRTVLARLFLRTNFEEPR